MMIVADLHIHSKHSRATGSELNIANLEKYARIKGITLLGTGDFTHPKWIEELKESLVDDGNGILRTKTGFPFMLQTEISSIYTDMGKGRKVHNLILAPNFEVAGQITEFLKKRGRVDYDGRPIFKLPCPELVESFRDISNDVEIIPAHVWTPYFGVFGSMSGFDSIREAYKDQEKHIHAIETGLSSDPQMNWRLSDLDRFQQLSFSDLHSYWPWRIGRESTIFDCDLSYKKIINAIRTGEGLSSTIEVDPSYGKYHYDGHRACNVSFSPDESSKHNNVCPACKKKLTIGVLNRVEELADRPEGFRPKHAKPFYSLIPLSEIISMMIGSGVASKKVWAEYNKLVSGNRTEIEVMLKTPETILYGLTEKKIAEAIIKNRKGDIKVIPGYDGEYGIPVLGGKSFKKIEKKPARQNSQAGLLDFI